MTFWDMNLVVIYKSCSTLVLLRRYKLMICTFELNAKVFVVKIINFSRYYLHIYHCTILEVYIYYQFIRISKYKYKSKTYQNIILFKYNYFQHLKIYVNRIKYKYHFCRTESKHNFFTMHFLIFHSI